MAFRAPPEFPDRLDEPTEIETPGVTTIDALAELLGIDSAATSKAMPVVKLDGKLVLGLVRGDDRLEDAKMVAALGSDFRPATEEEIREAFGADPGSLGPVGFTGEIVADEALREGQFVAGANRTGWHLRGVEAGRDFAAALRGHPPAEGGGRLPESAAAQLGFQTAIEVGHIFKLDTHFSEPLGATYLDEDGKETPARDGELRHRARPHPRRRRRAAPNGELGMVWPRSIAPYDAEVVSLDAGDAEISPGRGGRDRARGRGSLRAARRPRPRGRREVRRRRSLRRSGAGDRRQEDARGRLSGRQGARDAGRRPGRGFRA